MDGTDLDARWAEMDRRAHQRWQWSLVVVGLLAAAVAVGLATGGEGIPFKAVVVALNVWIAIGVISEATYARAQGQSHWWLGMVVASASLAATALIIFVW